MIVLNKSIPNQKKFTKSANCFILDSFNTGLDWYLGQKTYSNILLVQYSVNEIKYQTIYTDCGSEYASI
jgi:hypothetical protein